MTMYPQSNIIDLSGKTKTLWSRQASLRRSRSGSGVKITLKQYVLSTSEGSNLFEIEVGEWCDTGACYISVPAVKTMMEWTCKNKKTQTNTGF
jgi:hypothetical protein